MKNSLTSVETRNLRLRSSRALQPCHVLDGFVITRVSVVEFFSSSIKRNGFRGRVTRVINKDYDNRSLIFSQSFCLLRPYGKIDFI